MADSNARQSSLRALKHWNFALFFGGNLLSNCGTWFQNIALALLLYRLTRSSFWVGAVNFAQFIGVVLLAPWAGSVADRIDRRQLIIATQIGATIASAVLAWSIAVGVESRVVILALTFALGATAAFATPALQAVIPALVPRDDLGAAIAMNSVTFNLARALGPVAGAYVVGRLGIPWAIGLNALSYVALAGAMAFIRIDSRPPGGQEHVRLRESFALVRRDERLLILLIIVAAVSLTMDPVSTLTPAYATRYFHRPDTYAGLLIGAFGAGAVLGSVIPLHEAAHPGRRIGFMLSILTAGMLAFAIVPSLVTAVIVLGVAGFGYLIGQTSATTQLQLAVADRERGRIMALWSVAFLGTRPFAALLDGGLAVLLGPRLATVVMAVPTVGAAALALRIHATRERDVAAIA
jgi:MFS family permease